MYFNESPKGGTDWRNGCVAFLIQLFVLYSQITLLHSFWMTHTSPIHQGKAFYSRNPILLTNYDTGTEEHSTRAQLLKHFRGFKIFEINSLFNFKLIRQQWALRSNTGVQQIFIKLPENKVPYICEEIQSSAATVFRAF